MLKAEIGLNPIERLNKVDPDRPKHEISRERRSRHSLLKEEIRQSSMDALRHVETPPSRSEWWNLSVATGEGADGLDDEELVDLFGD